MKTRILFIAASVILVSACKSTPDPEPVETATKVPVAIVPAPQPVPSYEPVPEPAPVVVDNSSALPITNAPPPGTLADFHYQSGGEGRVFFAYDQYDLSGEARVALSQQAQWLQVYPNVVAVIEGNADERGTREYNLALAARRAESVKSFLVSQGVAPNRLTTVSYGKERPIDGRSTESGWQRNRNAHTNLMSGVIG